MSNLIAEQGRVFPITLLFLNFLEEILPYFPWHPIINLKILSRFPMNTPAYFVSFVGKEGFFPHLSDW